MSDAEPSRRILKFTAMFAAAGLGLAMMTGRPEWLARPARNLGWLVVNVMGVAANVIMVMGFIAIFFGLFALIVCLMRAWLGSRHEDA